jgi:hypothetical protein
MLEHGWCVVMEMRAVLIEDSGALLQLFEDGARSFDMILRGCLTFELESEQGKIMCHPSQIHNLMSSCYSHSGDVACNINQLAVSSKARLPHPNAIRWK